MVQAATEPMIESAELQRLAQMAEAIVVGAEAIVVGAECREAEAHPITNRCRCGWERAAVVKLFGEVRPGFHSRPLIGQAVVCRGCGDGTEVPVEERPFYQRPQHTRPVIGA